MTFSVTIGHHPWKMHAYLKFRGGVHWLVRMEWRPAGWSVCLPLPLHHKVQKFSSGTGSPGWSRKKGHNTVVVCVYLKFREVHDCPWLSTHYFHLQRLSEHKCVSMQTSLFAAYHPSVPSKWVFGECYTLRTSALALCYSAGEYCAPLWCHSAHTGLVDAQFNSTVRLISGTLCPTPLPWIPVLANIEPPALRRKAATDRLVAKASAHESWPLHHDISNPP